MKYGIISGIAIVILLASSFAMVDADGSDEGFVITDGDGKTYTYDGPSDHIISTGYAVSHTLQQLGVLDKVVATDLYGSSDYALSSFGDDSLSSMDALNLGSIFSKDIIDSFEREVPRLHEMGLFDFDDTIILTTSSNIYDIRDTLNALGFTHVLLYKDVDDYDTVVNMMRTISLISTGEVDDRVAQMQQSADRISELTADVEPAKALYVWHNSNGISVGNTGIMSSILGICHAEQIGLDPSVDKGYYGSESDIIQLIGENRDAVVFINYSYFTAGGTISDFREKYLGNDQSIKVVEMDRLWNNYCFESGEALETIAQYLYPELFGVADDDSNADDGDGTSIWLYVGLAVVAIAVIVCVGVIRRP